MYWVYTITYNNLLWYHTPCHYLACAQVTAVQAQREVKRGSLDAALALGKKLRENPKTGQVTSVKDTLANLEMTWTDFDSALSDGFQQVRMHKERIVLIDFFRLPISSLG